MSLKLKIRKTKFTRKVNGVKQTGYIGRVVTNGLKTFEEILKESVHGSTIDYREAEAGVKFLLDGITKNLKEGYIVDLGPIGKLYPSVETPWEEDADDLKLSQMTGKVNYRPSDDILGAVLGATKQWATEADAKKPTTDEAAEDDNNNDVVNTPTVDTSTGTVDTSTNAEPEGDDGLGG